MRKIKIAQIGIGHDHARFIFDSLLRQSDVFEVIGFCVCEGEEKQYERLKEKVYATSKRMTLKEILTYPGLDAVTVECNEEILTKYAQLAIEHNLPVHMDKPGSEDAAAFEVLLKHAKDKELIFHLGYMYRYNPAIQRTMKLVREGALGRIYSVEAHMDCLHNSEKRQWLGNFKGGMMFFLGCHLVDLILQIQGVPDKVIPYNVSTGFDGVTAKDYGMAVFQYPNGVSFAKTCAAEPGGFIRRQLVVCGEKGTIELNPLERYVRHSENGKDMITVMHEIYKDEAMNSGWNLPYDERIMEPFNRYDDMMKSFAMMVCGEKENPYTYDYEILLHRIILCACGHQIDYKYKGDMYHVS